MAGRRESDDLTITSNQSSSRSLLIDSLVVSSSSTPPLAADVSFRLYKRRWYVLFVYSLSSFVQGYLLNNFGPIYTSMQVAFDWNEGTLSAAVFSAMIIGAVLQMPSIALLERFGLKTTIMLMAVLSVLSTAIRCVPVTGQLLTTLIVISCLLNSLAGTATFLLPPYISARWFGPSERRSVTAVSLSANSMGMALAFVVGPMFFEMPEHCAVHDIQQRYYDYCYWEFGVTCFVLIVTAVTFPREAKLAPSASAIVIRANMREALPTLLRSRNFWLLTISWTLSNGTANAWMPLLNVDLGRIGIDQNHAGPIGCFVSVVGCVLSVAVGLMADSCGHLKAVLIAMSLLAIEGCVWLLLITRGVVAYSLPQMYWATGLICGATSAVTPIVFELMSDVSFPVDEATTVGVAGTFSSVYSSVFVLSLTLPIGTSWMDWYMAGACIVAFPFALGVSETLRRSRVDDQDDDNCDIVQSIR